MVGRHPVLFSFALALSLRWLLVGILRTTVGLHVFGDEWYFADIAQSVAEGDRSWWSPYDHDVYRTMRSFLLPLALLFRAFGAHTVVAPILVAVLGAGAAALVAMMAVRLWGPRWGLVAGSLVALLPSQIFFSSVTLREAQSWLLLTAAVLLYWKAGEATRHTAWVQWAALTAGVLVMLAYLRPHTFLATCWALALASVWAVRVADWRRTAAWLLVAVLFPLWFGLGVAGVPFLLRQGRPENRRMANALGARTSVVAVVPSATEDAGPPSGYGPADGDIVVTPRAAEPQRSPTPTPGAVGEPAAPSQQPEGLAYLPRGLTVFLLEPLPWRTGSVSVRLAKAESLVWYPLLLLAVPGMWILARTRRELTAVVLLFGGLSVGYGMLEGNYGTAYRHRGEVVWTVCLAAVATLRWLHAKWLRRAR